MFLIDVSKLVLLIVGPDLWQQTERSVRTCLLQILEQGVGDFSSASFHIIRHFIEPFSVIVVLQHSERFHGSVEIIGNDGEPVSVVTKRFPARKIKILGVVGEVHATLQNVFTTFRRKTVKI